MTDNFLEALDKKEGSILQGMLGKGAMYNGRDTDGKSRRAGAAFGGDEAEAEKRGW